MGFILAFSYMSVYQCLLIMFTTTHTYPIVLSISISPPSTSCLFVSVIVSW